MVVWKHLLYEAIPFGCARKEDSPYIVLGVPMDHTTTYKPGTRFAPDKIREAGCNLEFFSFVKNVSLEHLGFNDLGNILIPSGDTESALLNIERVVEGLLSEYPLENNKYFFLGGEHLITYPIIKSLRKYIDTLIVFDAHLDMRNSYLGSKMNHATFLRRLSEETSVDIIHIGGRAFSSEEIEYLDNLIKNGQIKLVTAKDLYYSSKKKELSSITRSLGNIYISIDMDALDPSYAPGVSNPEPLGLDPLTLLMTLKTMMNKASSLIGLDIVEVNPLVDVNDITSLAAAKILLETISMVESKQL